MSGRMFFSFPWKDVDWADLLCRRRVWARKPFPEEIAGRDRDNEGVTIKVEE